MSEDPQITDPRDPYKRRDVVAELDRWLGVYDFAGLIDVAVMQRARDEIVALRAERDKLTWEIIDHAPERDELVALRAQQEAVRGIAGNERRLSEAIAQQARDEALEEAEIACLTEARDYVISLGQDNYRDGCRNCAAAIRALKDRTHD